MMLLLLVGAPGCRPLYHVFIGPASCSTCLFRASDLTRGAACQLGGTRMNAHGKAEGTGRGNGGQGGRNLETRKRGRSRSLGAPARAAGACLDTRRAVPSSAADCSESTAASPNHRTPQRGMGTWSRLESPSRFVFFSSSSSSPVREALQTHVSPWTTRITHRIPTVCTTCVHAGACIHTLRRTDRPRHNADSDGCSLQGCVGWGGRCALPQFWTRLC